MAYKVGDEVLLKAKIVRVDNEYKDGRDVRVEIPDEMYFWISEDEIVGAVETEAMPDTEPKEDASLKDFTDDLINQGFNKGLEVSWGLAKKFFADMSDTELAEIFGKHWSFPKIMEFTPQEALAKLKAYEEAQIEVGDVVEINYHKIVITSIIGDEVAGIDNMGTPFWTKMDKCKKTGNHIDIKAILEQIRG